jgi:hypothetical protein
MSRFAPMVSCLAVLLVALLGGCSKDAKKQSASEPPPASKLADAFWLKSEPAGAKPVAEVREKAKTGDQVVVAGRVGGAKEPFMKGAAVFTVVDASLKPCTDECETPWDYCCEPPDRIAKNTITVEFREGASPIKTDARGFHGLDHLKNVVVTGEARKDEAGNLVVVAKGVFVGS